jgi:hypothetical protein
MTGHYDELTLQAFHDGGLGETESSALREHLGECPQCTVLDRRVAAFDRAMRMLPLERTNPAFTQQVLARMVAPQRSMWLERLLEPRVIGGATIGLFGVAGTVSAVLLSMPLFSGGAKGSGWGDVLDGVFREISASPNALAESATRLFPQVFSQGALQISLAVVLLIPLFLFADRILARRRVMG